VHRSKNSFTKSSSTDWRVFGCKGQISYSITFVVCYLNATVEVLRALLMKIKFVRDKSPCRLASSFVVICLPFCMASCTRHEPGITEVLGNAFKLKKKKLAANAFKKPS
jgi:hypothetical protein